MQSVTTPQITGRNLEITPAVLAYVEKKLAKITRHLTGVPILQNAFVMTEEETKSREKRFVVEFTINANGTLMRAEERAGDLYLAIDLASEVMARHIERYKGKSLSGRRRLSEAGARVARGAPVAETPVRVVRVKRHLLKPMSVDEAVDQMELLGHDFFVFLNGATEEINVVYRRKEGNYGLIEPEFAEAAPA